MSHRGSAPHMVTPKKGGEFSCNSNCRSKLEMPVPEIEEPVSSHISSPTPAAAGHPSYY